MCFYIKIGGNRTDVVPNGSWMVPKTPLTLLVFQDSVIHETPTGRETHYVVGMRIIETTDARIEIM